jgi:hypothetical protein
VKRVKTIRQGFVRALRRGAPGLLALALLAGCGQLIDMGKHRNTNPRRLYVSDAARNDSLPPTLVRDGLLFVMQRNKSYKIKLARIAPGDSLVFYATDGNGGDFRVNSVLAGTAENDTLRSFTVTPPTTKTGADYYLAFLRNSLGAAAVAPSSVRLIPVDTAQATTLSVRLVMVRQLHHYSTRAVLSDSDKAVYARDFHDTLASVFRGYGITLEATTVVFDPDGPATTVDFSSDFASVPGPARVPGAIHLYLVDSIHSENTNGTIVGFAPREAFDLSSSGQSRVILNVRGGPPGFVAVTAAHEMGHFFGLRHTTASDLDMASDKDVSNRDDGFASTAVCGELKKQAVQDVIRMPAVQRSPDGAVYCLRVAAQFDNCTCPDAGNLMFPYTCREFSQKTMGSDQQRLLRNNLKIYQ